MTCWRLACCASVRASLSAILCCLQLQQMDRQKKESELLATLSEILKLYHKYLLYSLRPDLAQDRRLGLLENIKERARAVAERYAGKHIRAEEYGYKLLSRFLTRLNEKSKAYIDQYHTDNLPSLLRENAALLLTVNDNLVLSQFLPRLFNYEVSVQPTRATFCRERKSAPDASKQIYLFNNSEPKSPCVAFSESKPLSVEGNNLKRQLLQIKSFVQIMPMLEIDERQLRRKFELLVNQSQTAKTATECTSSVQSYGSKQSEVLKLKQQKACTCENTIAKSSALEQLYTEALERNRNIANMIRQHEAYYSQFLKKCSMKALRKRERETEEFNNLDNAYEEKKIEIKNGQYHEIAQKNTYKMQYWSITRANNSIRTKTRLSIMHNANYSMKTVDPIVHDLAVQQKEEIPKDRCNSQNNPSFPQLKRAKGQKSDFLSISEANTTQIEPLRVRLAAQKSETQSKAIKSSSLLPIKKHQIIIKSKAIDSMSTHVSKERALNGQLQLYSQVGSKLSMTDHESTELTSYEHSSNNFKSRQTLNKLLQKASSSTSVVDSNQSGSVLYLSKILLHGADKLDMYSDNNCKTNLNTVTKPKEMKKSPVYKQELLQRRAKIEALYNKTKPAQIGMLRSHIQFPKPEEFDPPSFLMACRSYQRASQEKMASADSICQAPLHE